MTKEGQYGRGEGFDPRGLYVVFDGPPSKPGRFVEVEDADGCSVRAGEWSGESGHPWYLGPFHDLRHTPGYCMLLKRDREQREQIAALQTQVRAEADMHRKYYERSVDAESRANEAEQARADMEQKLADVEAQRDRAANLQREAEERADYQAKRADEAEGRLEAEEAGSSLEHERVIAEGFERQRDESRVHAQAMREERDRFAAEAHDLERELSKTKKEVTDMEARAHEAENRIQRLWGRAIRAEDGKGAAEQRLRRAQAERDHFVEMIQKVRGMAHDCEVAADRLTSIRATEAERRVAASLRYQAKRLRDIIGAEAEQTEAVRDENYGLAP